MFVDVGAHDGISFNNTLFFEKYRDWTGINVEANPNVFSQLEKNRDNCVNINVAVCNEDSNGIDFILNTGYTEMISGLAKTYDNRHFSRLNNELAYMGGKS